MAAPGDKRTKPPRLEIRLLGRFEVLRDGEPIPEEAWGRRKTKTLLKVLLTDPGRVFTQDQLIDALFGGENVDKATENLYGRVSQLRRVLEPDLKRGVDSSFILRKGHGYSFSDDSDVRIDVLDFRGGLGDSLTHAEASEWAAAVDRFEDTLSLYRGEFLPEDRYEDWSEEMRRDLRRQYLDSIMELASCYEHLGRLRQSISCCQRVLALEPHRERAICQLMTYQANAGQRDAALNTYTEGERALREYLDVKPSAELRALRDELAEERQSDSLSLDPRRIAVLPLANFSPDPGDEHFAEGMTEELIGSLSKIRDLRVVARTSVMRYKDTRRPISRITRELNVGTLVEGSVRKVDDAVRVSIQLIDGTSEDHLWAEEYDCSYGDLLSTQRDVAEQVARSLQIQLLPDEQRSVSSLPTQSAEAHLLYMKGLRELARGSDLHFENAISFFQRAIAIDPAFARAHAKTAHAVMLLSRSTMSVDSALPRVRESLDRAFALEPQLPEAHAIQGLFRWAFERNSVDAEAAIRQAMRLNPSYVEAHECMRDLLSECGRYAESLAEAREALALSLGLDPDLYCGVGRALIRVGRFEEAMGLFEEGRAIDPDYPWAVGGLAEALERLWRWDDAEGHRKRLLELHPASPLMNSGYVSHLHSRARIEEGLQLVRSLPRDRSNSVYVGFLEGRSFMYARRHHEAIEALSRVAEQHEFGLAHSGWFWINQVRACAHAEIEEYAEAVEYFETAYDEAQSFGVQWTLPICETGIAVVKARAGNREAIPRLIGRFLGQSVELGIPTLLAVLYFADGGLDEGFKWLSTAVDRHAHWPLQYIKVHPWFDPARNDPRFKAVLRRMNLAG